MAQLIPSTTNIALVKKGEMLSPYTAGEALTKGYCVYLKSDGKMWLSGSAIVNVANHPAFAGVVLQDVSVNGPVTVASRGSIVHIADSGLTIGQTYFSGSTSGLLTDTKAASADEITAVAVSATDIYIVRGIS